MEENGLTKSSVSEGYQTKIVYKPTDLLVAQELKGVPVPGEDKVGELREKYGQYHYFVLSISKGDKEVLTGGGPGFGELLQTLSFRMGALVNLTTASRDTIPVADYAFQRTFGMSSATSLLFVFPREELKEDEWIQFNLKEFGLGLGNQNFRFSANNFKNVPEINFNKISSK